jgi:hypothetical protein
LFRFRTVVVFVRATATDGLGEAGEEGIGHLARGGIHQPRADLRDLAADLRVNRVSEQRLVAFGRERDLRGPLPNPAAPPCPSNWIV